MTQTLAWPVDLQRQDDGAMRAQGLSATRRLPLGSASQKARFGA